MNRLILVFLLLVLSARARIIVVPDSVSTISEGLNVAGYGDTVLVKPGQPGLILKTNLLRISN